jgi:hypothetical protein
MLFGSIYNLYLDTTGVTHEILQPTAKLTQGVLGRGKKGSHFFWRYWHIKSLQLSLQNAIMLSGSRDFAGAGGIEWEAMNEGTSEALGLAATSSEVPHQKALAPLVYIGSISVGEFTRRLVIQLNTRCPLEFSV